MRANALRVALLTDAFARRNGEVVDGVAHTLQRFAEYCVARLHEDDFRLTVVTHGQDGNSLTVKRPVEVLRVRPLLPLPIHPRWRMDVVPFRPRIIKALSARRPHLIHIATPGSIVFDRLFAEYGSIAGAVARRDAAEKAWLPAKAMGRHPSAGPEAAST